MQIFLHSFNQVAKLLLLLSICAVTGPPENVQAHGIGYNEIHVQWQQPTKRIGPVLQYTVAYAPVNKTIGGAVTMLPDQVPYVRRLQYSSLTTMCRLHGLYAGQSFAVWVWATTWTATGSAKGQPSQAVIAHTDGANSGGRSLSDLQALSAGKQGCLLALDLECIFLYHCFISNSTVFILTEHC